MALELIRSEVRRFLASATPAVVCIKGNWGVGKTYGWRLFLREAHEANDLAWERYAYVSLFGLNSLEELRYAIFESTVTRENSLANPDLDTFEAAANAVFDKARKWRGLGEVVAGFFGKKDFAAAIYKSAFLTVRNRLVCFDDLERAGAGLEPRDVLGLASFLKEERGCGVVLLLNERQFDEVRLREFERQLEKVADETLRFDISPTEAASVALSEETPALRILRDRVCQLGVNNIRVIKKMERLARRLEILLVDFTEGVLERAVSASTIASWSVQQPDLAPPLEYLRNYDEIAIGLTAAPVAEEAQTQAWNAMVERYPLPTVGDFELVVIDGAEAGYFDEVRLLECARELQNQIGRTEGDDSFTATWHELYHGSLGTDDDEFLDRLHATSIENIENVSLLNINSAIYLLRESGRGEQADQVVTAFVARDEPLSFFNVENQHFVQRNQLDQALADAMVQRYAMFEDRRDPLAVIRQIGVERSWTEADIVLFAKTPSQVFEEAFETIRGSSLKTTVETTLSIGRAAQGRHPQILRGITDALRRIAAKSPLRARRLAGWNLDVGNLMDPAPTPNNAADND